MELRAVNGGEQTFNTEGTEEHRGGRSEKSECRSKKSARRSKNFERVEYYVLLLHSKF